MSVVCAYMYVALTSRVFLCFSCYGNHCHATCTCYMLCCRTGFKCEVVCEIW